MIASRTFKLGPQGLEVTVPAQPPRDDQAAKLDQALTPADAATKANSAGAVSRPIPVYFIPAFQDFIAEMERRVEQDLPGYSAHLGKNTNEAIKHALVENLGALYLERASRHLFGSQIDALNFLIRNNGKARIENLRPFYAAGVSAFPTFYANYSFEQWLAFMTSWNLIKIEREDVTLAVAGKAIIPYMQNWGYLVPRPPG